MSFKPSREVVDPPSSPRTCVLCRPTTTQQNNCTLLEGQFSWAAAASVLRRVCRVGRELKTACSREILGVGGGGGQGGEGGETRIRKHGAPGGSSQPPPPAKKRDPHRPLAKHGSRRRHPARKNRRRRENRGDGATAGDRHGDTEPATAVAMAGVVTATNRPRCHEKGGDTDAEAEIADADIPALGASRTQEGREGEQQQQQQQLPEKKRGEQAGTGDKPDGKQPEQVAEKARGKEGDAEARAGRGDQPPPQLPPPAARARALLSKEAALLKAAEDTDGGKGAMLFSEFVEALARLCLARYGPRATDRRAQQGPAASAGPNAVAAGGVGGGGGGGAATPGKAAAIGAKKLGVGGRKAVTTLKTSFAAEPVARGTTPNVREEGSEHGQCFFGGVGSRKIQLRQSRAT